MDNIKIILFYLILMYQFNNSKILKLMVIMETLLGWYASLQINHMDMVDSLKQIMNYSLMDNSKMDKCTDILDGLHKMVTMSIKNGQMVHV